MRAFRQTGEYVDRNDFSVSPYVLMLVLSALLIVGTVIVHRRVSSRDLRRLRALLDGGWHACATCGGSGQITWTEHKIGVVYGPNSDRVIYHKKECGQCRPYRGWFPPGLPPAGASSVLPGPYDGVHMRPLSHYRLPEGSTAAIWPFVLVYVIVGLFWLCSCIPVFLGLALPRTVR